MYYILLVRHVPNLVIRHINLRNGGDIFSGTLAEQQAFEGFLNIYCEFLVQHKG